MSDFDDDPSDMTQPADLDDHRVEALLRGTAVSDEPRLADLLSLARAVGHGPVPQPSPALAALLAGGVVTGAPASPADRRWRRRLATLALVSVGSSAALVGAAAANVLPQQAQQVVARVVNEVTPIRLPGAPAVVHRSPRVHPPASHPAISPSPDPTRSPDTRPTPTTNPTPTPTHAAHTADAAVTPSPEPRHSPGQGGTPAVRPTRGNGDGGNGDGRDGGGNGGGQGRLTATPTRTRDGGRGDGGGGGDGKGDGKGSGKGNGVDAATATTPTGATTATAAGARAAAAGTASPIRGTSSARGRPPESAGEDVPQIARSGQAATRA